MNSSSASPLLPLFCAVDVVAEDAADTSMDWPAVDVVTDRSCLRNLLRWIRHADTGRSPRKDFRIDLQLGGAKTVLMQRWDTRTCQYLTPPFRGCRANFDRAATIQPQGCCPNHFRIIQYVRPSRT